MDCPVLQLLCTMVRLSQHSRASLVPSPSPYSCPSSTERPWRTDLWIGEGLLFSPCTALCQPLSCLAWLNALIASTQLFSSIFTIQMAPFVDSKCHCRRFFEWQFSAYVGWSSSWWQGWSVECSLSQSIQTQPPNQRQRPVSPQTSQVNHVTQISTLGIL